MIIAVNLPRNWLIFVLLVISVFSGYGEQETNLSSPDVNSQDTGTEERVIQSLSEIDTLPVGTFHQGIIKNLIQTNLARYSTHQTFSNYLAGNALAVKSILHPASNLDKGISISIILLPAEKLLVDENKVFEILEGILIQIQNTMGYFGLRLEVGSIGGKLIVQRSDVKEPQIEDLKAWITRLNTRKNLTLIASELIRMAGVEMEMKQGLKPMDAKISLTHVNTLKSVIQMIGWPSPEKVGTQASHASWLIALQADFDRDFQKQALSLILSQKNSDPTELAFLTDRLRVLDGQKQVYGTQYEVSKDGNIVPLPIEDFDKLDERRAGLGLDPFAKYLENLYESLGKSDAK